MKEESNTAEVLANDEGFDDMELLEGGNQDRTLILKSEPPSRRVKLMAEGAKSIRCICCCQVKLLAEAEECEEGWVCEDCMPIHRSSNLRRSSGEPSTLS